MPESYYSDYSDHSDEQLDELLCEYVDGTMDPSVRAAFEEYLAANPELAQHARCLSQTRTLLCSYGCRHPNELSLQDQIKRRVAGELFRQDRSEAVFVHRLGRAAMLTSTVSLVLILGMTIGLTAVRQVSISEPLVTTGGDTEDSMTMPTDAYARSASLPLEWNQDLIKWSLLGPSSILPEIDLVPIGWRAATVDSLHRPSFRLVSTP